MKRIPRKLLVWSFHHVFYNSSIKFCFKKFFFQKVVIAWTGRPRVDVLVSGSVWKKVTKLLQKKDLRPFQFEKSVPCTWNNNSQHLYSKYFRVYIDNLSMLEQFLIFSDSCNGISRCKIFVTIKERNTTINTYNRIKNSEFWRYFIVYCTSYDILKLGEVGRPGGADQYVFDHISFH